MTREEYDKLKGNEIVVVSGMVGVISPRYAPATPQQWKIETLDNYNIIPLTIEQFLKDVELVKHEQLDQRKL